MSKKLDHQIIHALHYVKRFTGMRMLIKLGGSILDNMNLVRQLCEDLSLMRAMGIYVVLVHGGSRAIETELTRHNITWSFFDGQRVTTKPMMDVIEMVLCGHVNRFLVRGLNAVGVVARGICGSDAKTLLCSRINEQLGEVGKVERVNTRLIESCFGDDEDSVQRIIPVIAPIGVDHEGNALNVNADWAATAIAQAMNIKRMIYLTDQTGINNRDGTLISKIDKEGLEELIRNEVVTEGMLTKTRTIIDALERGVNSIHIINARQQHALIHELFTEEGIGTQCANSFSTTEDYYA